VIGINFSGGMASVVTQVATALGANFTVSNPSGNTLRILDDGGVNTTMNAASATKTVTSLASGGVELPLFMDGASPYTGAIGARGSELVGFAGRISFNPALTADPSKLVLYGPNVPIGDTARASFLLKQISETTLTFPSETGIGSAALPYQGSIAGFVRQVLSTQGDAAANAQALSQGQDVVVNALQQRATDTMGVNIDEELSNLLQLQSAYAANARVMSAVKDMLDLLSKM
jgi:flagellar hook-associated protein 1 FlgK